MRNLLSFDSPVHKFVDKFANLMILNFVTMICCIPIITAGPALTSLFYVTMKMVRNEEGGILRNYFHSFRTNFLQGMLIGLIVIFVGAFLGLDLYYIYQMLADGKFYDYIVLVVICVSLILYFMASTYVYPLLAKFENSTKQLLRTSLLLSIRHLPATLAIMVISLAPFLMLIYTPMTSALAMIFYLVLGFAAIAYFQSVFFVRIFDQYIPKDTDNTEETTV